MSGAEGRRLATSIAGSGPRPRTRPQVDIVIVEHPRYAIVEKWLDEAGRVACAMDPRR